MNWIVLSLLALHPCHPPPRNYSLTLRHRKVFLRQLPSLLTDSRVFKFVLEMCYYMLYVPE